jgi:hypothetical protein
LTGIVVHRKGVSNFYRPDKPFVARMSRKCLL